MRFHALALAGAATAAILATLAPAAASETSFFLDQHRAYFEGGAKPQAIEPAAPIAATPDRQASAEPAAEPQFRSGRLVGGGAPEAESRPLASAIPREIVAYSGSYAPGMIVVSTEEKRLYYVLPGGQAIRYGVGVGRPGFEWSGAKTITAKREWPDWTPPPEMIKRRPDLPRHMKGGIENPLGARAMYLGGTEYRIHGSNEPDTIGQAVSSGCIRMTNEDVADLYEHAKIGTKVVVAR